MNSIIQKRRLGLLIVSALLGSGLLSCGGDKDCEGIEPLKAETKQPAVVKLYFQLKNCGGQPVAGLKAGDFVIEEDGKEVSVYESDQNIITDPKNFKLATVLIVDMSGSILSSGNLPSLQQAAKAFVSTLGTDQSTAIYTFDGRQDVQKLIDFTNDADALKAAIDFLTNYEVVDKSTNLNGAVISGLSILDSLESQSEFTGVLFAGSLAVFTDGTDQAGRVSDELAVADASETAHAVFSIGLGGEVDQSHLKSLGKDGAYFANNVEALESTFQEAAADIEKLARSYYILAYCSPKRAGTHTLRLTTRTGSGFLEYTFNANGFEGGCSPDDFLTDPANCQADCSGKQCGDDGCGGNCGACAGGVVCKYGTCDTDPANCQPACDEKDCGDDGCGGSCGNCFSLEGGIDSSLCNQTTGKCCAPDCEGKDCGDNGCGGVCGECAAGNKCSEEGLCVSSEDYYDVVSSGDAYSEDYYDVVSSGDAY